ncbi:hypothetical protein [Variovorax saccharolyticus]|uniref:hypothetical protein n=1 Tax=Variovorax saccharolyticus TaxID=3053516 RepID=UPI0025769185|nr:hypothetical protein [Variovorax sp. J31P216]MDM0024122.1 hypothetical protein [Variovorax sp. J31P216]
MTADTQAQGDLPELPKGKTFVEVFYSSKSDKSDGWYAADQMREYGRLCVAAALQGRAQEGEPSDEGYERMRRALTIIANWALPETGKFWDEEKTRPTSYETEYGSNGARDYMRSLASMTLLAVGDRAALAQAQKERVQGDAARAGGEG